MYVFSKKNDDVEKNGDIADGKPTSKSAGKGRPTPKRKESEQARRKPVIIGDPQKRKELSRERRKREKQRRDELFARQQEAMISGDERYLPLRDKGKNRRFLRDFIDARYTFSEWLIPLVFISLVLSIAFSTRPDINSYIVYTTYVMFILALIESLYYWSKAKRQIKENHQKWDIPPRSWWYVFSRMLMIRRWRRPLPMVKRGEYPN